MKSAAPSVRSRSRSRAATSTTDEEDEKNKKAVSICKSGKDIYSSVLGPTVDETLLLGLQTFLGRLEGTAVGNVAAASGGENTVVSSVFADGGGSDGGGGVISSPKSTKFAACKYKYPENYMDQDVQTLPPGYTFKCNKAVACPPECRVKAQNVGDDAILVRMTDSIVGTEHGFNFSVQTAGPQIDSCGSQTVDLLNTSSSQTSRITLTHAPVQTQRQARTEKSCPSFACVPDCVGDTNQQGIPTKYAITKITTFASYTTFEVMRCTRKKPKCMPSSVMGVFVLKNLRTATDKN
nr:unnamed protein product [Callosobruchus chinensis]